MVKEGAQEGSPITEEKASMEAGGWEIPKQKFPEGCKKNKPRPGAGTA